ncbi:putative kelch domain-containing protein [Rosellinia necatrix]|uniref:Putative kelch domain-containing protein n=1 Tax=Rosellinia necatrix TaxID=77044 RepID=A0A1W2TIT4_ROSNE|nr:putative kelch domain-containing protein [Rosellinia necatrix]
MSASELTCAEAGRRDSWQAVDDFHVAQCRDQEHRSASALSISRSPSDLFSDVYRGIKRAIPTREDSFRLARSPSRRAAKAPQTNSVPQPVISAPISPPRPQHARGLSLQHSLEKPLPAPPPISPSSPLTPIASTKPPNSIGTFLHSDTEDSIGMESRSNTMDSTTSVPPSQVYGGNADSNNNGNNNNNNSNINQGALGNLSRPDGEGQPDNLTPRSNGPQSAGPSPQVPSSSRTPALGPAVGTTSTSGSSAHLSGLMCNVHRTTGREPHPLVGATTTILGDKLYVFGGRILSRSRPAPLTSDLYELDLIRRHWTKIETSGDIPPPRYFHSMCALGDSKMVCYGGMSPITNSQLTSASQDQQAEITVMSDIYIYDVPTKKWTYIPSQDTPQGRYAHCACIMPSSATFVSHKAPLSALQHNPSTGNPNEGRIGVNIDGTGGAEMIIVGGQDGANHYIEQISVFNLRSLKWTSTQPLGKSCGAYRSVVAPLSPKVTAKIGKSNNAVSRQDGGMSPETKELGSSMLIYSNYNFLDVKLELQIRGSDGSLVEKPMSGTYSPPGLRFPNGGVTDTHFVVSGTYLTSSKQEYALWALDLKTLTWSRIDAGASVFSQGSWNRGVVWNRRNTFVVLGSRKRSLVDDYNHRRINFSNVCMVELEAFGFYDNPRKITPMSGFLSASSPFVAPGLSVARKAGWTGGGRFLSRAAEELGEKALSFREIADMEILCIGAERIPINSRIVGRRWGPYFVQLLREGAATQDGSDAMTLRTGMSSQAGTRVSTMTITQSNRNAGDSSLSLATTLLNSSAGSMKPPSTAGTSISSASGSLDPSNSNINSTPTPASLPPASRPRCLYLPHTHQTVQALLHFLYTSSLPPQSSQLCTPQILCSLLQIARPYKVDGLLEAVVERLHSQLDSRNAAAVFNATAMAAGGGRGIDGSMNPNFFVSLDSPLAVGGTSLFSGRSQSISQSSMDESTRGADDLRINTSVPINRPGSAELSANTSVSGSEWGSEVGDSERGMIKEVWTGELSSVIGLQKRGLRGLMEGRRMRATVDRERDGGRGERHMGSRVGLGIAGS